MGRHRMLLSVDDDLFALLKELSDVSGIPAATFIVQILGDAKPNIQALIDTFKILKKNPVAAIERLEESLARTIHVGAQTQIEMIEERNRLKKTRGRKKKQD